jgi:hypothetical protein
VKGKVKRGEGRRRNVRGERWGRLEIKQGENGLKGLSSTHAFRFFLSLTCGVGAIKRLKGPDSDHTL